jgi:ribonucleoside-diphosphate reductase alpha chain
MVVLDADHPEIEDFIDWKAREEQKAAALWAGSRMMTDPVHREYMLKWGLMPQAMLDRMASGIPFEEFSLDYEGEAIRTVGGQNANNSVRLTDDFMRKLSEPQGALWYLKERTTGKLVGSMQAAYLWEKICRAAWASADPGLQFHDTINKWHTCKADGEIRATNPCGEYNFLDNTACNLASLNLGKFYKPTNPADPASAEFDINLFCHVARLMTIVLDISVSMASFPSREIAVGSYNYRTLGLGYANLGGLLMRMGLAYDSDGGRSVAANITALMHGVAYKASQDLSKELGAFPRWESNKDSMAEVISMHHDAVCYIESKGNIGEAAFKLWEEIRENRFRGFRNAQVTLLAPTGTIGLLMDCDTLGVEPDFSLVKHKSLAGGGDMTLVNLSVDEALTKLGYKEHFRNLIKAYIKQHGTVEGCGDLDTAHWPVFDCAVPPEGFTRSIAPIGHVKMVAAVQPFLSGAVSKTINIPNSATVEDVSEVYIQSWKLGLKAVALYRDGSKLAQPLNTSKPETTKAEKQETRYDPRLDMKYEVHPMTTEEKADYNKRTIENFRGGSIQNNRVELSRGEREYLPWRREDAYVQKIKIGPQGQSVFLTIGKYPDGRPGEIYVELGHAGSSLRSSWNLTAMMISIGLQYGVPIEEYVRRLEGIKFEPSGFVEGHGEVKFASSIADYIARDLALTFLGDVSYGQVQSPTALVTQNQNQNGNGQRKVYLETCPSCGEPALTRSGTCQTCLECGYNDGCGG